MLAEDPSKVKPKRSAARFEGALSSLISTRSGGSRGRRDVAREQICASVPPAVRCIVCVNDAADLDHAIGRVDAHQALIADRAARGVVEDREIVRIDGSRLEFDVGGEFGKVLERPVEEIGPDAIAPLAVGGGVKRLSVLFRVERRERDPPAFQRDPLGPPRGIASAGGPMGSAG